MRVPVSGISAARHVELEHAGDQDDGLRLTPSLAHRESNGFRPIDEQSAAQASLVLRDPAAVAVHADEEACGRRRQGSR
jgi:hypothetical protein